jgi:hypothetical protein
MLIENTAPGGEPAAVLVERMRLAVSLAEQEFLVNQVEQIVAAVAQGGRAGEVRLHPTRSPRRQRSC